MVTLARAVVVLGSLSVVACGGDDGGAATDAALDATVDARFSDACIAYRSETDPRGFYQGAAGDYCTATFTGASPGTSTISYDELGRRTGSVLTFTTGPGPTVTYAYDPLSGDLLSADVQVNLARNRQRYFYDDGCHLIRIELDSDIDGTVDGRTLFTWTGDRIVERTQDGVVTNAYGYDAGGQLEVASVYSPSRVDQRHVWTGDRLDRVEVDDGADGSVDATIEVTQTSAQLVAVGPTATTTTDFDGRGRPTRFDYDAVAAGSDRTTVFDYACRP